jgi:hypothetical protein
MSRAQRFLIIMPLLAAALTACGGGTVPVTAADPPADPPANNSGGSGSSSSSGSTSSSGSGASATTDVLTYHYNAMRSGENLTETVLTPANVTSAKFGKLRTLSADGLVDAAPLVVTKVTIAGVLHSNVVYIASEHDSVYAYDADIGGTPLAQVSLLGAGEETSDAHGCDQVMPEIGITATPVIDRSAGPNGTIFVVAMSKKTATGAYIQRLHALDLATLQERPPSPVVIQATYPGTAGAFAPGQYKERGALLLQAGQIYTSWASHCDAGSYNSWIMAYNETTLAQTAAVNLTPNGSQGGIWDVAGLAVDSAGALYTLVGNGKFDSTLTGAGFPNQQDYGNAAVKLTQSGATISVSDYFATSNTVTQSQADTDLGSGSPLLIADQVDSTNATRHLMLAVGKDANLYLLDRDNMGKFNVNGNTIYQQITGALGGGSFSAPVYFNGSIYLAGVGSPLKQFKFAAARLPTTATSQSAASFSFPGTSASISANGTSNAIVWAAESNASAAAVLHAYDPANLAVEYYNSTQAAGGRDSYGNGNKFITPVVADGMVFVGTSDGVAVFGLL